MIKRFLLIVWCCLYTTAFGADITFDAANVSHSFDGFGAQIWPGDSRVKGLTTDLNLKYYRLCPGGCTSPPNDVTTAVMDAYVSSEYSGTTRGNAIESSLQTAEDLGVKMIFIKFGCCPSSWLGTNNKLNTANFDDFARIWASEVLYFKNLGYTIDYIELLNEPEGSWNVYVPAANYNTLIKLVRTELDSRGLTDVGIIGPGLAYLYYGTTWINALDSTGKSDLAAWSTHAWDEGWGNTSALPSFLDQRWQDYFGAAVDSADPCHLKPVIVTEYATGVLTYNGVTFDSDEVCDSNQFAQRCYENSLTLANNGANVLCYWEAANQSWQSAPMYGFVRTDSTYRPVYYAFSTIAPYIPDDAQVLTKTWDDSDISAAGFIGSGKLVLAFANSTASEVTRTISVNGVTSFSITSILAFEAGEVSDKTSDYSYDFETGSMEISLPAESTLTIVADVNDCNAAEIGDLDGDCKVTFTDFAQVAADWMQDNRATATEVIDDFESYADSTALNVDWVVQTNANTTTETLVDESGNAVMKLAYEVESPYWCQTKYTLPGAVLGSSGINWTYLGYTSLTFKYKITDVGSGVIYFSAYDYWSQKVLAASWTATSVTSGWVTATVDFSTALQSGMNLGSVCIITFGASSTWYSSPTGDIFIDDIMLHSSEATECSSAIDGDITNDCVVDFDDIKVISENWLECTLVDQSQCW